MVLIEKSFPRGGSVKQPVKNESENVAFGARQKKKQNGVKSERSKDKNHLELSENIEALSAELLNYKTVQEGMILMGYIEDITATCLKVALPGRMYGEILASNISDSYNKILHKVIENSETLTDYTPLNELYAVGQKIYVKVMKIQTTEFGKIDLELSIKPKDVHSDLIHENLKRGMIFNGVINELQEHGYVIETGIKNLRCFLPFENTTNMNYGIGQLVCIKLDKLTQSSTASTAICKEVKNNKRIKDLNDPKLEYILPTSIVHFTITKTLKDGLQGTIMNGNFTAYCNEHNLSEPLSLPTDYEMNSTHLAEILYIMPITKLVYVSLNLNSSNNDKEIPYKKGDIIEDAVVSRIGTGGIILAIDGQYKGLISFKSIKSNLTSNFDQDELLSKYYKNSKHKIRIIHYDVLESLYICTDNPSDINEKYYTLSDVKVGEFVTGIVEEKRNDGYYIQIGKIRGYVDKLHLSSGTGNLHANTKTRFRILAKNPDRHIVYLTNRPEYMSKNIKILTKYSQAKENRIFMGTVVKCKDKLIIIKFFNDIKGVLYKNEKNNFLNFYEGQTMNFRVSSYKNEKLILSLIDDAKTVGDICKGEIANILQDGIDVILHEDTDEVDDEHNERNNQIRGLIPIRMISEFSELITLRLRNFQIGEIINEMICMGKNNFSLRDVEYFKENPVKNWGTIQIGDVLRGFIKNVDNEIIEIFLPIIGYSKLIKIHRKMLLTNAIDCSNIMLHPEQIVYVKILSKSRMNKIKTLTASAKLTDVWNGDLHITAKLFEKYLNELQLIGESLRNENKLIGNLKIGSTYSAKVIEYDEDKNCIVQLENNTRGIIKNSMLVKSKKLSIGAKLNCIILWIDYLSEIVYLSHNLNELQRITEGYNLSKNFANKIGLNAKVLLITKDVIVCSLKKGKNSLVFIPTRVHYNDFENSVAFGIQEGQFSRLAIIHDKYSIGIFEDQAKFWHKIAKKRKLKDSTNEHAVNLKKMKMNIIKENTDTVMKQDSENLKFSQDVIISEQGKEAEKVKSGSGKSIKRSAASIEHIKDEEDSKITENGSAKKIKKNTVKNNSMKSDDNKLESKEVKKSKKEKIHEKKTMTTKLALPGPSDFWSIDIQSFTTNRGINEENSSEDDDNSEINLDKRRKKKITATEKFQAAKEEEERLREIEEKNANPNVQPETVDQFERLVLSNPNDSKIWINYMVFHLQATEIEKAKMIGRKALKMISYREEQQLLNIWIALLNLELRYGTKETFNDVLKESVLCNDPYKIYTRVFHILSDAKKGQELSDLINICTKKFKDKPELWKNAAIAYFEVDLHEKAKQLLHKALAVLPEREHINTIATFANLNHKYGDKETAHALFEQILTSYPKRVDIWSQYVDMLIKDKEYDSARLTLDRAVVQKIPLKKMRTIYKKYLDFEEKYGTHENVLKVKEMAANYVQKEINI